MVFSICEVAQNLFHAVSSSLSSIMASTTKLVARVVFLLLGTVITIAFSTELPTPPNFDAERNGCVLSLLIPFKDTRLHLDWNNNEYKQSLIRDEDSTQDGISLLTVATLAIYDFNRKQSEFVTELEESFGSCTFRFSEVQLIDTLRDASHVVDIEELWANSCAVVGIPDNQVASALVADETNRNIPFVSYGAYDDELVFTARTSSSNNLVLSTATWRARMDALVKYLERRELSTAALVYAPGKETETYFRAFQKAATGSNVEVFDAPSLRNRNQIASTLRWIHSNRIDTIVVAWERDDHIDILADVAHAMGMLTCRYTWIFLDSYLSPQHVAGYVVPKFSALELLLSRAMIFQTLDPFAPRMRVMFDDRDSETKRALVLEELQSRATVLDTINEFLDEKMGSTIDNSFFAEDQLPAYGGGFLYDSIIATGMAACSGLLTTSQGAIAFEQFSFEGVTGLYQIQSGARVQESASNFGVYVLRQASGRYTYEVILQDHTVDGEWILQKTINDLGLERRSFIFGMTMAGIAFAICFGSAFFLFRNRFNTIITVGQPLFLYFTCFGCSLFAFGIVFLSFDDVNYEDMGTLDTICMVRIWMRYAGQIVVYMALFSKLWRVKKLGEMRKQTVLPRHVIWPFLLLLAWSISILMTWTFMDPAVLVRTEFNIDDDYVDPFTVPSCSYEGGFYTSAQIPLIFSMVIVFWMAYKTKDLPEEYTDARKISKVLLWHILIYSFGSFAASVAVFLASYNIAYVIRVWIDFLYVVCTLGILIFPRFWKIWKEKQSGQEDTFNKGTVRVSGL